MTPYETLSVLMSSLGLVAVVASIWFLRGQVKLMSKQTQRLGDTLEMSAESALDLLFTSITQVYMDHPRLRGIFNEQEGGPRFEDLSQDDQLRANALAESLLDSIERAIRFHGQGLAGPSTLSRWIEDSFRNSSFLRAWLREHATWYLPEMSTLLREVTSGCRQPSPDAEPSIVPELE